MTGNQFNTLMSIFYVGYLLTQAPSYVPARYPSVAHPRIQKQHVLRSHDEAIAVSFKLHGNMGCYNCAHGYVHRSLNRYCLTRVHEKGVAQTLVSINFAAFD
jgi:hypothetical protein